ncbi:KLC1 [Branchiostoma lanceolatum]|uniref:KLC1 protein n=1 Tax=Branchiostoma lanceolatum TaxID=7740 RepID=A0A8J9Z8S8_BRALA|nr:KLC1 [Branchiostoma lanceolatum]
MAANERSQTTKETKPGLLRPDDLYTPDYEECLQKGNLQIENGDLHQAEETFAGALRLVAGESREREAVCLLRLGEVYKKWGELSCPKDHGALIKASALLNDALARIDKAWHHHALKHDPSSSQDHGSARVPPSEQNLELQHQDASPGISQVQGSKDYIKGLLQEIEIVFVNDVTGVDVSKEFQLDNVEEHKRKLMQIRSECETKLDSIAKKYSSFANNQSDEERKREELAQGTAVRDLYCKIAEDMKTFVRDLLEECIRVVGAPHGDVTYAVVGLGSLAREGMTPYSDLEFAILVQEGNNTDDVRTYFQALTRYLHLKILNLGETILPAVGVKSLNDFTSPNPLDDWYHDSLTPRGFAFDGAMPWASKTPLGREQGVTDDQLKDLILIPSEMAALQTDPRALSWSHLREVLTCVTLIHGDPSLVEDYETLLRSILFEEDAQSGTTLGMRRATKNLTASLQEFKTDLSGMLSAGKLFQVKKEIYRMPSILLSSLGLFFGIRAKSSWEIIQVLHSKEVINVEAEHNLKVAVSIATQLRLQTYLSNAGQKDNISTLSKASWESLEERKRDKNEAHPASDTFGMESHAILFRFFQTVLPLEEFVGGVFSSKLTGEKSSVLGVTLNTLNPQIQMSFETEEFYDSSLKNRALVDMRLLQYQDAKVCLEKHIAESDVDDASQSSVLIGQVMYHLGDYAGAVTCFQNLADQKVHSNKDRFSILNFLGQALHQNGDLQESLRCFEKVLKELRKKEPESDLSETVLLNNLACALRSSGKYPEAISCFEEALALDGGGKKQKQGNPRVAVILNNMGDAYQSEGQYAKSIQCYTEALTIEQRIYGDNRAHPFMAATLHNLGSAYRDIGNFSAAMSAFRSSLQIKEIVFGEEAMHPEIATTLDGLAAIKRHLGDFAYAQQLNTRALHIRRNVFGDNIDNLEIAESLTNMGINCLDRPEDFQQGLPFLEEAYEMRKRIFKVTSHTCVAKSLHNIGVVLYKLEQYELAKTKYQEALEMFREVGEPSAKNLDIAAALGGIGSCLCRLEDKSQGRVRLEEAVRMFKTISGSVNHDLIKLYSSLAKVMIEQGDIREAKATLMEALDVVRNSKVIHEGENTSNGEGEGAKSVQKTEEDAKAEEVALSHYYTAEEATILGELGVACVLSGDDRAMSFLQESLTAARQVHGDNHLSVATVLGNMGAATLQGGNVPKAIEHFMESLQILEDLYGEDGTHTSLEEVLTNLGYAYEENGDLETALAYFDRVLDIQRRKGVLDEADSKT